MRHRPLFHQTFRPALGLAVVAALAATAFAEPKKPLKDYQLQTALDANGQQIQNLPAPASANDAARKVYVDAGLEAARAQDIASKALAFDGTAVATLSSPTGAPGTGDFTISFWARPDADSSSLGFLTGATAGGPACYFNYPNLVVAREGIGNDGAINVGAVRGETAFYSLTRRGGFLYGYRNGVLKGYISWPFDVSGGVSQLGGSYATYKGLLALITIDNRGLTDADQLERYNDGGIPRIEEKGGTTTSILTGAWSNSGLTSFSSANATTFTGTSSVGSAEFAAKTVNVKKGERYLFEFDAALSGVWTAEFYGQSNYQVVYSGHNKITFTISGAGGAAGLLVYSSASGAQTITVSNAKLTKLGVTFQMNDASKEAGYQIADVSGGGHHVNLPATGVSIINPAKRGRVYFSTTTSGAQQICLFPKTAILDSILVRFLLTEPYDFTVGTVGSGANLYNLFDSADHFSVLKNFWAPIPLTSTPTQTGALYGDFAGTEGVEILINFTLP